MPTVTANEAKARFGAIMEHAQREPRDHYPPRPLLCRDAIVHQPEKWYALFG